MILRLRTLVRTLALGLAIAAATAGVAAARDYIVVNSTDPAIARGQGFDSGARIAVAPGQTVTLMHASGDLVRFKGAASGVILPRRVANAEEADRLAILKVIVAPAERQVAVGLRTRTRAICPDASVIATLDGIVKTHQGGCETEAAQALDAWIATHPPTDL